MKNGFFLNVFGHSDCAHPGQCAHCPGCEFGDNDFDSQRCWRKTLKERLSVCCKWNKTTRDILKDRLAYLSNLGDKDTWMQDSDEYRELIALKDAIKHLSIPEMVRAVIYKIDLPQLVARWGDAGIRRQNLSTLQHIADDYARPNFLETKHHFY